jgi:PAS domain S-box-containing protein
MNLEKSGQLSGTLAAYEEQYRILFDHNPNPMWVYDLETLRFLAVNDAAVYHYGYSRDEFFGMTIRDIRPPEDLARLDENLRLAVVHSDPRMIGYAFELQKRYAYMQIDRRSEVRAYRNDQRHPGRNARGAG